jgi:hypothetical protein
MSEKVFGDIADIPVGSAFTSRRALSAAGVHRRFQSGIG